MARMVAAVSFSSARPAENPPCLQKRGRADRDRQVAGLLAAGFKQQRHVEHDRRFVPPRAGGQKRARPPAHQGMKDFFQASQRGRIGEHQAGQFGAVGGPVFDRAGESLGDLGQRRAARAPQAAHLGIGIVPRNAQAAKGPRGSLPR